MAIFDPEIFFSKSGMQLTIRHITAQDAGEVKKFVRQIAEETTHTMQYVGRELPDDVAYAKRYDDGASHPLTLHLGAFDGEKLVAYLNIRPTNPDHPWAKHIAAFGMMVLKDFWGQGIGKRLMTLLEVHARKVGFQRIEAQVRTKNERGVQLYKRFGYTIEGTRKAAVLINGEFHDEYFIAKVFCSSLPDP